MRLQLRALSATVAVLAAGAVGAASAAAAPGDLDSSFGTGGIARIAWPGEQTPEDRPIARRQPDGKTLLLIRSERGDILVRRLNGDLTVDAGFGVAGTATIDLGHVTDRAAGLAVLSGGKIVLGGSSGGRFFAARLTSTGQLDPTYDGDGIAWLSAPLGSPRTGSGSAFASAFTVDSAERVVVAGTSDRTGGGDYSLAAARFSASGAPDTTFGTGGVAAGLGGGALTGPSVEAMTTDSSNRVIFAAVTSGDTALLLRLTSSGARDPGFGTSGFASVPVGDSDDGLGLPAVVALPDSRVVLMGREGRLARYTVTGALDTSFGSGGVTALPGPPEPIRDAIAVGDAVLVAHGGRLRMISASGTPLASFGSAGVAELLPPVGATLDTGPVQIAKTTSGFVVTGTQRLWYSVPGFPDPERGPRAAVWVVTAGGTVAGPSLSDVIKVTGQRAQGIDVARQSSGKLVVLAQRGSPNEFPRAAALTRLSADGSTDSSFGSGGFVEALDAPSYASADLLVQPDDKIVVGASNRVWRRAPSGQPDASFGTGGETALPGIRVHTLARTVGGKLLVAGNQDSGSYSAVVTRLTSSGAIDTSFGTDGAVALGELGWSSDLVIGASGDIYVGGQDGRIARLTENGQRVTAFGPGGIAEISPEGFIREVKLAATPNGVLVAYASVSGGVRHVLGDGQEDPAFLADPPAGNGDSPPWREPTGIVRQGDGRILIAARVDDRPGLVRLNPDGSLDSSFGAGGMATTSVGSETTGVGGMTLLPDGTAVTVASGNGDIVALKQLGGGAPPPPAKPIADVTLEEGVPGGRIRVTVRLAQPASGPVTVRVATEAATAVAGVDFTAIDQDVVIPAGTTAATVDVPLLINPAATEDRYLVIRLSSTAARLRTSELWSIIDVPEQPAEPAPAEPTQPSPTPGAPRPADVIAPPAGNTTSPTAAAGPLLPLSPAKPAPPADIKTEQALKKALGKLAKRPPRLRSLAKTRAFRLRLSAPVEGRVTLQIYSGKRRTKSKLIATGRRTFKKPSTANVRARLNKRGKRWSRSRGRKTITVVVRFVAPGGEAQTASKVIRIKR